MFGEYSYIGYTILFTLPPLTFLWLRREFSSTLRKNLRAILWATFALTVYGSIIWPIALSWGAWAYTPAKISGIQLFGFIFIDDLIWWILVSFLFSSFVVLAAEYEERGENLVCKEAGGFWKSVRHAAAGFEALSLERNIAIHASSAVLILLASILFRISTLEWLFIIIAITLALGFELWNTALERLADRYEAKHHEDIRKLKDTAATAVLLADISAVAIGAAIFLPRILAFLEV